MATILTDARSSASDPVQRLRKRSRLRRSFFVGRPVPRARWNSGATYSSRGGAGGLWSTRHSAAIDAATRRSISWTTSTTRSRSAARTSTRSPTRTGLAGLAALPLILTWPPLHASVANDRVLNSRTAHSH